MRGLTRTGNPSIPEVLTMAARKRSTRRSYWEPRPNSRGFNLHDTVTGRYCGAVVPGVDGTWWGLTELPDAWTEKYASLAAAKRALRARAYPPKPNGAVIYRGPSMLDGAPIVVVVTGLRQGSANGKTGRMLQTWILVDGTAPGRAARDGSDRAICGACPHRRQPDGKRTCYVRVDNAPRAIWEAYQRGVYPDVSGDLDAIEALGAGRLVRLGSYGDPMAVPLWVWVAMTRAAAGWTGYAHQWRTMDRRLHADWARLVMASVDTEDEQRDARDLGYRTFRVRPVGGRLDAALEVTCPASAEAGHRSTCADCRLCMGTTSRARKHVVIEAHGAARRQVGRELPVTLAA